MEVGVDIEYRYRHDGLIRECTLNHILDPYGVEGVCFK